MVLDEIKMASLPEVRPGLHEMEWDRILYAFEHEAHDPYVITEPGIRTGFSATGHFFDLSRIVPEEPGQADILQHWFHDDGLVPDWKTQEERQPSVCLILVFTGTADPDVVPSLTPVLRKGGIKTLRPLGNEIEGQV